MQTELLVPDAPVVARPIGEPLRIAADGARAGDGDVGGGAFARLVDAAGSILAGADRAQSAFVARRGGLQEMVVERARADVALAIATSAAQRATQAISSVLGMQI